MAKMLVAVGASAAALALHGCGGGSSTTQAPTEGYQPSGFTQAPAGSIVAFGNTTCDNYFGDALAWFFMVTVVDTTIGMTTGGYNNKNSSGFCTASTGTPCTYVHYAGTNPSGPSAGSGCQCPFTTLAEGHLR